MPNPQLTQWYRDLHRQHPELMEAVDQLGAAARKVGPLDDKTAQLIQLAAAAACRSEGAVHSHVRRALAAGASDEEIRHAVILLTSTIGFPNVSAALRWVQDVLDSNVEKT